MSLLEDSLASHSVTQGSAEARMMTAISGRTCFEQYKNAVQLGSLVRMLLESQRWQNQAKFLKWEARPLYSERRTLYTPTNRGRDSLSSGCVPTSRVLDMQSNRLLFRLVPLERLIDEIECSSLLKTPTAWDYKEKLQSDNTPHSSGTLGQKAAMGQLDYLKDIVAARIGGGAEFTNTNGIGRYESELQTGESAEPRQDACRREQLGRAVGEYMRDRWRHFPTESPIHRGNDGIPFDVDSLAIPFNKWRQEALKAYGNAIVPQVMYEIFLAIDQVKE